LILQHLQDSPATGQNQISGGRRARNRLLLLGFVLLCGWSGFAGQASAGGETKIPVGPVLGSIGGDDLGLSHDDLISPADLAKERGGEAIAIATMPGPQASNVPRIILWDEVKPSSTSSSSASGSGQIVNQRVLQIR
jgi:hypothetical protein